jgi:hypothetical protein
MADGSLLRSGVRHGGRCGQTMFTKQVSHPVDGLDPHRGRRGGAGRANSKKDLVTRPIPGFLCPTGQILEPASRLPKGEGHRNSDYTRDLPISGIGSCTDRARPQGLEHARDPTQRPVLGLKHSSLGSRALPQTRCGTSQIVIQGCLSMTGRRNESQVSGMILINAPFRLKRTCQTQRPEPPVNPARFSLRSRLPNR